MKQHCRLSAESKRSLLKEKIKMEPALNSPYLSPSNWRTWGTALAPLAPDLAVLPQYDLRLQPFSSTEHTPAPGPQHDNSPHRQEAEFPGDSDNRRRGRQTVRLSLLNIFCAFSPRRSWVCLMENSVWLTVYAERCTQG